jgi:CHASE3 domain sensor protein
MDLGVIARPLNWTQIRFECTLYLNLLAGFMMHLALRPRGKIASLGVLMLVALASAITLVSLLKQLEDQAWVEHTLDARSRLLRTLATLQDAEIGERGFLLTNDENFLEPYDRAVRAIEEQFDKLGKAVSDNPQQLERLSKLRDIERQRVVVLRENIERRRRATNWARLTLRTSEPQNFSWTTPARSSPR